MRRTRVFGCVSALVVLGGFVFGGPTSAKMMKLPVDGAGSVSCNVTGLLKFNPPLQVTSTPVPTTVTLHAVVNQCTGTGDGARVVTGVANVSGQSPTNDCLSVLENVTAAARSGALRWRTQTGTARLNPSTITFDAGSLAIGPPITTDATGSSTGSFSGDTASAHVVVRETYAKLAKACTNMHGLRAVHFAPGSTFALVAPSPPAA